MPQSTSPSPVITSASDATDPLSSKEYKTLQIQYNKVLKQLTDSEILSQKKIDDMAEFYEKRVMILETRLKREEKNVSFSHCFFLFAFLFSSFLTFLLHSNSNYYYF